MNSSSSTSLDSRLVKLFEDMVIPEEQRIASIKISVWRENEQNWSLDLLIQYLPKEKTK